MQAKQSISSQVMTSISMVILVLGICSFAPQRIYAQAADPKAEGDAATDEGAKSPKVKVERGAGGKKVYVIKTDFVIEGRIQKPNAFYVLQRSQINYDWAALKQRFVPRILESLNKSPF
jgi:hypothetical protein